MNSLELEYARKRKNKSKEDMAAAIGKSVVSYSKKERGEVKFTDEEKVIVTRELDLTNGQVNTIFFDGNLPERIVEQRGGKENGTRCYKGR